MPASCTSSVQHAMPPTLCPAFQCRPASLGYSRRVFAPDDPAFLADPYPAFAALREQGEVHGHDGLGIAVTVSHAASAAVLRHRGLGRIWTDATPLERFTSFNLLHRNYRLRDR